MTVNTSVIYYSSTGANYTLAHTAAEAAQAVGANVRLRKVRELAPEQAIANNQRWFAHVNATVDVPEATLDDLDWADAIVFSVPTRFGSVPSQFQQFIDTAGGLWAQGKLANKVVTAMSSASNAHGGQEATLLSLYTTMYHWGAIVVTPGYTDPVVFTAGGNPYGTSVTVTDASPDISDAGLQAASYQAKRLVQVASWLKSGQSN
ncbi:NAD(P)H:quinone oxidoreductase [Alicyclobacillus sp. ALC3]|uniref:NAD(P)H:quinone oxidoreductase n=1 Tax=Alicyclobacillus sp. ALC3 TaxID=2796143 RepID=UPI002377ED15|nr:NAD(P)H:quinone oxidoreductase [Alicyclobacillus sp. ALC3]WDL97534.1 NAD(P)H:quinone oxidoreductase [Alicyclobacillus sp. ALC3]